MSLHKQLSSVLALVFFFFAGAGTLDAAFTHPGLLHSQADLDRIKASQNIEPWKSALAGFAARSSASKSYVMKGPFSVVTGEPNLNLSPFQADMEAASDQAMMWAITGDQAYANKAIQILDAWSGTLTSFGSGEQANLFAAENGMHALNAAEILRYSNSGWSAAGIASCEDMFATLFWPAVQVLQDGNIGAAQIATIMMIGVFNNDQVIFDYGVNAYRTHLCSSLQAQTLSTGQNAEFGRDQAHAFGGHINFSYAAQTGWNQGIDLFSEGNNRLLAAYEYFCNYNLGNEPPAQPFGRCRSSLYDYTSNSSVNRGVRSDYQAVAELAYNHFAIKKGYKQMPNTQQFCAFGAQDNDGILLFRLAAAAPTTPAAPTGVTATALAPRQVRINWPAVSGATSYTVMRSLYNGWHFGEVVATGVGGTSFDDVTVAASTPYYYVVSADNATGKSAFSAQAIVTTPFDPNRIAINCGGPAEGAFQADAYFSGGGVSQRSRYPDTSAVTAAPRAYIYILERNGAAFSYTFPGLVTGAHYKVRLHLSESVKTAAGQRLFNVSLNAAQVMLNYDIYAEVGAFTAITKEFATTAGAGGQITLQFNGVVDKAAIKAIEVLPTSAPPAAPTSASGLTPTPCPPAASISPGRPAPARPPIQSSAPPPARAPTPPSPEASRKPPTAAWA